MSDRREETRTEILSDMDIPEMVQPERKKKGFHFTKPDPKDPMVIILVILLVFLTCGTAFGGCVNHNRKVIELDAAYGGDNSGYAGIVKEADVTQKTVDALVKLLNEDGGYDVKLTHEAGTSASVKERSAKINRDKPDFVLSIHADGSPDASLSGQYIYADIPTDSHHADSLKLADFIKKAFTDETWKPQAGYLYYQPFDHNTFQLKQVGEDDTRDYKLDTWDLMKQCDAPVVISDAFHVSNQADVDTWANDKGYQKAAENYYKAIRDYYGSEK